MVYTATPENLSAEAIESYRKNGFIRIQGLLTREEAEEMRQAALSVSQRMAKYSDSPVFTQLVNVWREDPTIKRLTLNQRLGEVAERLAGVPLRLWHDQLLIKQPHNNAPTEFHQDQPYWPHANSPNPISAWIALVDVPVERGCMSFIPGSHSMRDLPAQNLRDPKSLFSLAPDLAWEPRVTLPLRAGDCTFHHGRCAHTAGANQTDEPRVAHVVIFMDAVTTYNKKRHVVTDPLDLPDGSPLEGELFPAVSEFAVRAAG